jgi:hypothetical protein
MEITTSYTNHDDLAEAIKGAWGKEVGEDYTIIYFGQGIIGKAASIEILEKHVKIKHTDWDSIGNNLYFSVVR